MGKLEWCRYPMVKKFRIYLYSFWRNSRTWRTDWQTPGDGSSRAMHSIARQNQLDSEASLSVGVQCATVCHHCSHVRLQSVTEYLPSSRSWKLICLSNEEHHPAPLWLFLISGAVIQVFWLTYLLNDQKSNKPAWSPYPSTWSCFI